MLINLLLSEPIFNPCKQDHFNDCLISLFVMLKIFNHKNVNLLSPLFKVESRVGELIF